MGTWGPGAFDNDDALDLLDTLTEQDAASRRETLERIFRTTREHPENLNWTLGPGQVVAAAAVVAAGLPAGEASLREITGRDYDLAALLIPGSDPELADAALAALLIAAGRDGAWHQGWVDAGTALQARRTTDQLASVFYRYQHRNDRELPRDPDGLRARRSRSVIRAVDRRREIAEYGQLPRREGSAYPPAEYPVLRVCGLGRKGCERRDLGG